MVLVGTADNPIRLDGKVVLDGDVVIRGYIQGTGQLSVSGNIYIPGDIVYKNGTSSVTDASGNSVTQENFGVDPSGKTNLLGLMAGKNIVVGDYLSQVTYWWEGYFDGTNNYTNPDFFIPRKLVNGQVVAQPGSA